MQIYVCLHLIYAIIALVVCIDQHQTFITMSSDTSILEYSQFKLKNRVAMHFLAMCPCSCDFIVTIVNIIITIAYECLVFRK